jgi:hypothetical protein
MTLETPHRRSVLHNRCLFVRPTRQQGTLNDTMFGKAFCRQSDDLLLLNTQKSRAPLLSIGCRRELDRSNSRPVARVL